MSQTAEGPGGRRRIFGVALLVVLGLVGGLWTFSSRGEPVRVLAATGVEVEVVTPESWSHVQPQQAEHPLGEYVQAALARSDQDGQILAARLFGRGGLDRSFAGVRGLLEQAGARILDDAATTLDGREVRLLDYELGSDADGSSRLHRTYLVELDVATNIWVDVGEVAADDEGRRTLDRIGATLEVHPEPGDVEVELLTMADDGQVGEFWTPRSPNGQRPGVLLLGGSAGGVPYGGGPLAQAGYPTLAMAYHGADGLPDALAEIPLESFRTALEQLAARPEVDPDRLIIWGSSRGGEAALLIASAFPESVDGVVANVPADTARTGYPDASRAAWTLGGEPIVRTDGQGRILAAGVPIKVERIVAPVLLTCGTLDTVWASCSMSRRVVERFEEYDHPHPVVLHEYNDAGHDANFPPIEVPPNIREAGNQGWRDALEFLDDL